MSNWKITYMGDGVAQIPGHPAVGCFARNTTASVTEAVAQSVKDHSQWAIISPDGISWPITTPIMMESEAAIRTETEIEPNNQFTKKTRSTKRFDRLS
jgi:hypothetical protein